MNKLGLLLIQLGSPKSPKVKDVKAFLKNFLGDPRVVDNQSMIWKIVLNLFVLPSRSPKSAEAYAEIWDGETFPLFKNTELFTQKLQNSKKALKISKSLKTLFKILSMLGNLIICCGREHPPGLFKSSLPCWPSKFSCCILLIKSNLNEYNIIPSYYNPKKNQLGFIITTKIMVPNPGQQ